MKKKISLLTGFLGLQLVLALSIYLLGKTSSAEFVPEALLQFDSNKIDKLVISDPDKEIIISKNGYDWILAKNKLAIEQSNLDRFMKKLEGLKTNWPVTTTSKSHERFEVTDQEYKRKISLYQEDKLITQVYLGTSPGFKKSHIRVDGQNDVYALGLNYYDVPITSKDWMDKSILGVKAASSIKGDGFNLTKTGNEWKMDKPLKDKVVDQDKVHQFVNALGALKVQDIANEKQEFPKDKSIKFEVNNGERYLIHLMEEDGKYLVKRSDIDHVFTLSKKDYEGLIKPKTAFLIQEKKDEKTQENGNKTSKTTP